VPTSFSARRNNSAAGVSSTTARNGKLRQKRKKLWREAEAVTRYWRARLDFDGAVEHAQRMEIPEGRDHPIADSDDRYPMLGRYREAIVKQLLTPPPDGASVAWKQNALARGKYLHTGLTPEHLELVIAQDLAFLAAHPVRQSNRRSAKARDDGGAA
jgi:hypothetical protein